MQSLIIKDKLIASHPSLANYFSCVPEIDKIKPKDTSVLSAISKIIVGQMLSRKVASTILLRAENLAVKKDKNEIALLKDKDLRSCGISHAKTKAIKLFAEQYYNEQDQFENWRNLDNSTLFKEVNKHWGLSNWSASMLAIFYLGFEDVYPENDGSIKRVTNLLEQNGITLNPEKAAPYRSYLALYLWEMLDQKLVG